MTEIFTAKSVDEAKELAAAKFGKKISEIKFEIIDEGKKGFLGLGKTDAKVKAVFDEISAKPQSNKAPVKVNQIDNSILPDSAKKLVEAAVAANHTTSSPEVKVAETVKEDSPISSAPVAESKSDDDDSDEYSIDNFTLIEDEALINSKVKLARDYIISILKAMDVEVTFMVYQNETGAILNIESNNNGTVIGRRGETLDALQYLCSIIANKGDKDYFRITVDCFGYRKKRKETLEQLASKVAKSVIRTGRSQPLEPMNPYERRVIHSAISKIDGVSSRSVGEEPYRKIIISSNSPRKSSGGYQSNNRRRPDKGHRPNTNNSRDNKFSQNHNSKNPEQLERRSVDVSTSFEKDYKKPKPEDNIEGGLYGKIEF